MSIKLMSSIWEQAEVKGTQLLMLLAIADFANDNGKAWPAVETLAKKCRMKERNAQAIIRQLEALKLIEVSTGTGPSGCNVYTITGVQPTAPGGVQPTAPGGAVQRQKGVQPTAPDPSLNHQENLSPTGTEPVGAVDPKPALALSVIPDGEYLQAQITEAYEARNRKAPTHFKTPQQRDAFAAALAKLNGQGRAMIAKGIARDRIALPSLLAWLDACAKNRSAPSAPTPAKQSATGGWDLSKLNGSRK